MNFFKTIFGLFSWVFLTVFILMVVFTLASNTSLLGGYKSFLVQSGSMEPSIMTGDIIIIHQNDQYIKNDVITFSDEDSRIVTHRLVEIVPNQDKPVFITKGDANRSEDNGTVLPENIVGKVILVVPKLGFLVAFVQSLPGLILLILVPSLLLIVNEIFKLLKK